jgi:hypothetical protein
MDGTGVAPVANIPPLLAELQAWSQIINAIGTMGLLLISLWAFYNGKVISKPVYDLMVEKLHKTQAAHIDTRIDMLDHKLDDVKDTLLVRMDPKKSKNTLEF